MRKTSLAVAMLAAAAMPATAAFEEKVTAGQARDKQRELMKRKTTRNPQQQREAYFAAEAKRLRKQAKRLKDAGRVASETELL